MEAIKQKILDDCLKKLAVIGCKFCVIGPDGEAHGDLKVAKDEEPKIRRYKLRWAGVPLEKEVAGMSVGDVRVVVARPEGSLEDLRSALSYRAKQIYGKDTITAMANTKTNSVEIMRTA